MIEIELPRFRDRASMASHVLILAAIGALQGALLGIGFCLVMETATMFTVLAVILMWAFYGTIICCLVMGLFEILVLLFEWIGNRQYINDAKTKRWLTIVNSHEKTRFSVRAGFFPAASTRNMRGIQRGKS